MFVVVEGALAGGVLAGALAAAMDRYFGTIVGERGRYLVSLHPAVVDTVESYDEGGKGTAPPLATPHCRSP